MKIVRPHDGSLIIRLRPGLIEYLIGVAGLLPLWILLLEGGIERGQFWAVMMVPVIAGSVLAYITEISDFTFDPAGNQLRWDRKTLCKGLTKDNVPFHGQVPLGDIGAIEVLSHRASGGDYEVHKVVLTTPSLLLPLTRYAQTGRGRSEKVAQAIQRFLNERGFYPHSEGFGP